MTPSSTKSTFQPTPVAGVKRPAPAPLLPAFEPTSSSPRPLRPIKRLARAVGSDVENGILKYPTPVPTSSTGILSSSPPFLPRPRPALQRTQSSVSERAPLSALSSIPLPANGEAVLMGRSSNSSHYQLSANRLISRVHVRAAYIPAVPPHGVPKVEVTCVGWNGVKVHCQGRAWDLSKGDSFTSETEHDIMLDVHHARVLLAWPTCERTGSLSAPSESTVDDGGSPWNASRSSKSPVLNSSPLRRHQAPESPVSPTPVRHTNFPSSSTLLPSDLASNNNKVVSVYEDDRTSTDVRGDQSQDTATQSSTQVISQPSLGFADASQSSEAREPEHFSDQDEENDPIIHSFGPQGDNILPRMASFTTADSPLRTLRRRPFHTRPSPRPQSGSETTDDADTTLLANHVINQLAFSRLASTPLSTILHNLPVELKGNSSLRSGTKSLAADALEAVLKDVPSIGRIRREGKDAAGKPLESEYHYIPDLDTDDGRREAVVNGLRKPGLRACRKQHKVSDWPILQLLDMRMLIRHPILAILLEKTADPLIVWRSRERILGCCETPWHRVYALEYAGNVCRL